ncbi:transglycosylase SLT domain-containing protein [Saccharopolyspora erythraea]|uniref:transglycosylase SLT domain-containing protein n=1 Tax=Saccharopolyspora erythraea TaxID=1836 RepID=UPI001BAA0D15|nr:transglycosylase SLT domain-containing protein [Saccharopolyspora erythraea]
MANIVETITSVAQQHGVDPILALATAYQESKLNPRAVGDNGTSFGLYQLHRGGQLGNHTPEWAFNPANNANQALSVMADVARDHPTWSPGQIAAASQRPANKAAYATNVNNWYRQIKSGQLKLNGGPQAPPPTGQPPPPGATPAGFGTGSMLGLPDPLGGAAFTALGKVLGWANLPNLFIRIFCGFLGVGFIAAGVFFFVTEGKSS